MGHQDCRLKDGVILLWLPKREEGAAGCEDLLNLLVAGEVTHNGLVDGRGSLDRQRVHEHGRGGRHVEGSERSFFVNGRLFVGASSIPSLLGQLAIKPGSVPTSRLAAIEREA